MLGMNKKEYYDLYPKQYRKRGMDVIMKITDKKKPVKTIPQGVWESSRPDPHKEKSGAATESTDLQGTGYPQEQNKR